MAESTNMQSPMSRLVNFMTGNKIQAALWLTRVFTVVSSFIFFIPIIGGDQMTLYNRVLLANAATSALRLHQRLPNFQFSREFFAQLFLEDSAHYLFFTLIFVMSYPVSMALIPVFLFALMHATTYTKSLLNVMGPESCQLVRNLIAKLDNQQRNILRFIACTEIFLMPMIIYLIFVGRASLLQPFLYFRFLSLRYASRRNPYCRQLFYELKSTVIHHTNSPKCPQVLRNVCSRLISFISNLAPVASA